jgi:beta-phosphoglucomutase
VRAGVLFDMDGVLVDSWEPHLRSWRALAAENGLPFQAAWFPGAFGKKSREIIASWWPGRAGDAEALDARKEQLYRAEIRRRFPPVDGAADLVRALHAAGFRLAVASSGPPENVACVIDALGVRDCFDATVSGRDVERGKPDPAVFLAAAARLGIAPGRCLVVEDAPVGVDAAHRGGMAALAVLTTGRREEDFARVRPERVVRSLREVTPASVEAILAAR